ncbi:MAG: hypothetical protein SVK54_02765 [candidate division WOR-3 bacterium]|nr:hypothetical protein [candidate division WOR-3 bacterium]
MDRMLGKSSYIGVYEELWAVLGRIYLYVNPTYLESSMIVMIYKANILIDILIIIDNIIAILILKQ